LNLSRYRQQVLVPELLVLELVALRQQVLVPELRAAAGARRRQVIPADVRGSRKRPTHADYPLVPGARATPTIRWYLGGRPITAGKYFYIIVRTERD